VRCPQSPSSAPPEPRLCGRRPLQRDSCGILRCNGGLRPPQQVPARFSTGFAAADTASLGDHVDVLNVEWPGCDAIAGARHAGNFQLGARSLGYERADILGKLTTLRSLAAVPSTSRSWLSEVSHALAARDTARIGRVQLAATTPSECVCNGGQETGAGASMGEQSKSSGRPCCLSDSLAQIRRWWTFSFRKKPPADSL